MVCHRRIVQGNMSTIPVVSGFNYSYKADGTTEIWCSDDATFTNIVKTEADLITLIAGMKTVVLNIPTFTRGGCNTKQDGTAETECNICKPSYLQNTLSTTFNL